MLHVNLLEKLLVPALSKLSNLVPGGGIWMNTQRPEWNDANNALAGGGISVVTLCYLRRYLGFLVDLLESPTDQRPWGYRPRWPTGSTDWRRPWKPEQDLLTAGRDLTAQDRKRVMDALGACFSALP